MEAILWQVGKRMIFRASLQRNNAYPSLKNIELDSVTEVLFKSAPETLLLDL